MYNGELFEKYTKNCMDTNWNKLEQMMVMIIF
jgi:hypothetical protein